MAKLTARVRAHLPKSSFALPGSRKYPIYDRAHQIGAKARAKQQLNAHKISKGTYGRIVGAANRRLGKKK